MIRRRQRILAQKEELEKIRNKKRLHKFVITAATFDEQKRLLTVSGDVYNEFLVKIDKWGPFKIAEVCDKIDAGLNVKNIADEKIHVVNREGKRYIRSAKNDCNEDNLDNLLDDEESD